MDSTHISVVVNFVVQSVAVSLIVSSLFRELQLSQQMGLLQIALEEFFHLSNSLWVWKPIYVFENIGHIGYRFRTFLKSSLDLRKKIRCVLLLSAE